MSIITNNMAGRIKTTTQDKYNRRHTTILFRKHQKNLAIITSYIPNKKNTPKLNTYLFQLTDNINNNNKTQLTSTTIHKLCWTDLCNYIQRLQNAYNDIILFIDSNIYFDSKNSDIYKLQTICQLHDPINTHNDKLRHVGTHTRGSKLIDGILVSQNIIRYIHKITYNDSDLFCRSDHSGIYMEMSHNVFKHRNINDLTTTHNRRLRTQHIKTTSK